MAKQLVGPVERHLEKAVLGIAGILLLGAIAGYLVTSPNQLEIGGETVSPKTIDAKVVKKATDVRRRIETARPTEPEFEPLYDVFEQELDPFKRANLPLEAPAAVFIGPEVPTIDKGITREGEKKLVEVVKLTKPVVKHGRSTFHIGAEGPGGGIFRPADWVTVSAVFNVEAQSRSQQQEYGAKREQVVFGPIELQRRARRNDGSWSEDDWESVHTFPADEVQSPPDLRITQDEGEWVVPKVSRSALEGYFEDLRDPARQLGLVRPLMIDIRDGTPWEVPIITNRRDVLLMDWEYNRPNEPPEEPFEDRYPDAPVYVVAEEDEEQETPEEKHKGLLAESERFLRLADENRSEEDATRAYNRAFDVKRARDATQRDKTKAERLMRRANQLLADIKRERLRGGSRGPEQSDSLEQGERRDRLPLQQVWAHDARPGSVKNGRYYQYRMRLLLYNRLAGEPGKFADPVDAQTVFIPGPWSEPSEAVTIEPDTYFFMTKSDERKDNVTIEEYQWFEGVWVKNRETLKVGDALECRARREVPSLDGEGVETPLITFAADGTIVDIDHRRQHRERKRAGRGGVRFESPSPTCAVVYVDSEGRLHERFLPTDKGHPAKATVARREWKPPKTKPGP
jgi:hypothetical protein